MQKCRKSLCVLLLCALLLPLFAVRTLAAGFQDPGKLTIQCRYGTDDPTPVKGMKFSIYRVADIDHGPTYTLCGDFAGYNVDLNVKEGEKWASIAQALKGYAQMDGIDPTDTAVSGEDGTVKVDVPAGLYLVVGQRTKIGRYTYWSDPSIVSVPDIVDSKWNYDVTMLPKLERKKQTTPPPDPEKETVDRKVIKEWDDEGKENYRPKSISVALLRNGTLYDMVKLTPGNNWSYEWRDLPANDSDGEPYEWLVVEEPMENYSVTMEIKGITYVLVNTIMEDIPPEEPPLSPPPDEPPSPPPPDEPSLPQTGVLWWPVPVLLCLGVLFLTAGAVSRRREEA